MSAAKLARWRLWVCGLFTYDNECCDELLGSLLLDPSDQGDEVGYQSEDGNE